ncbi:MAG TPA: hypothetical protein VJO16_14840 [Candidatus Acidoferrum sp.]|nr:hypothetical protein [Candidatus Acidoferrum sp.]
MSKKQLAIGLALVGLLLAAFYLRIDSATPLGQEPLATLSTSNFARFETAFDESTDGPRLILLLSPT